MVAGDAHRVWFPEMVEHLRLRWRDDQFMEALLELRDELDDMLGRIRLTRHISNPVFKCPACGHIGRGADPHVSVRATILALARFRVAAKEPTRALEKAWSAYRKTFERTNWSVLRDQLQQLASVDAELGAGTRFGQKYVVRGTIHGPMAAAAIVTVWIVLHGEDFPRFVTAYPGTR